MNKDRSGRVIGGLLASVVAFYFFSAYDDIYERRKAYLYDPETDDVYAIELGPYLSKHRKWDIFIPFKKENYTEPDAAEYVGKLHSEIAEFRADMDLLGNDPDAWSEKQDQDLEQLLSGLSLDPVEIEFWNIEYFRHPNQDTGKYIPETLSRLFESREIRRDDILVVDAVIARNSVNIQSSTIEEPVSVKIVSKGTFVQGLCCAHAL